MFFKIINGLHYLHTHKIIHRDIKSGNVLYDSSGNLKLADFGFAVQLTEENPTVNDLIGTDIYMAPELL